MILRRVIEHVKAQNWFAVAIDFVIVVLGVFVGIQVSNWNAAQADARLGRDYVARLTRDLTEDRAALDAQIAYYAAVHENVLRTDELLRAPGSDPRALVISAYRATEISYFPPVRATWDQIISSGHLGMLPAGAAESGLSQYYAFDNAQDVYRFGLASEYRQAVRKIIPMRLQIAFRDACSDLRDARGNIVGFMENCELDAGAAELAEIAAALRADPVVAAALRYQYSFSVSSVLNLGAHKSRLEQGLAALGPAPAPKVEQSP